MFTKRFNEQKFVKFKHFTRRGYALFNVIGKVVVIGFLSVSTLTYAAVKRKTIQTNLPQDTVTNKIFGLEEVSILGMQTSSNSLSHSGFVSTISQEKISKLSINSISDILKMLVNVDVRQRGGFGIQTDVSINGGTFDQTAILLNGIDVSNPQTGHNSFDLPISAHDIERIEILTGTSGKLLSSSAFNGAINIITKKNNSNNALIRLEGGMYGSFSPSVSCTVGNNLIKNYFTTTYSRSDGALENSEFKKCNAFYNGFLTTKKFVLNWQLGASSKKNGANTFYSAKYSNQYEETKRYIASITGSIKLFDKQDNNAFIQSITLNPSLFAHINYDHYQLIKGVEGVKNGENYHKTNVFGANLITRIYSSLGKTQVGLAFNYDHIYSTTYGNLMEEKDFISVNKKSEAYYTHNGNRSLLNIMLEQSFYLTKKLETSLALSANKYNTTNDKFNLFPHLSLSWKPNKHYEFYAQWGQTMRMPTYTDLYSLNAVVKGNVNLSAEKNNVVKIAALYSNSFSKIEANVFYNYGENMIDWVYKYKDSKRYEAINIGKLHNVGFSFDGFLDVNKLTKNNMFIKHVKLGYAYIYQKHNSTQEIYKSLYALEYLKHKVTAEIYHNIYKNIYANWSFRWQERMNGYKPYSKIDLKLTWKYDKYDIFINVDNLTSHRYYDLGGVLQPGLWIMFGGSVNINI